MSSTTYDQRAITWAQRVVDGEEVRGGYVVAACQRFLDDLERAEFAYVFDAHEANRRCAWIERLPHVKGRWAAKGERLVLSDWQVFVVCNLFGWKHRETMLRRFRESYVEVPRKNGKSLLAAAIGLNLFAADDEYGAEVYSGATTEKQAWEVFRPARQICERLEALRTKYDIEVHAKNLAIMSQGNRFEPIIGNPGDGASPSCAIVDEFHEHKSSELIDTMTTGMGARDQPLLFVITTAGSDFGGPCRERRQDMIRILDRTVDDETVFGVIFTLDEDDDWTTPEALEKANPNIGVSVSRDFLLSELAKAKRSPTKQTAFKTKHLNLWVGAKAAWMNMLYLQRCKKPLNLGEHDGQLCFVGIDLASKIDIAAMALLFPRNGKLEAFFRFYLPQEAVYDGRNDRYVAWAETGEIITTPGETIDFSYIEDDLKAFCKRFDVPEVAFDPYQATQFSQRMMDEGLTMVEVRPTWPNFSEPMKALEGEVVEQGFRYDSDVFTWMVGNVVVRHLRNDIIFPDKEKPENKIDGVVALLMAMNRYIATKDTRMPEDYELTVL